MTLQALEILEKKKIAKNELIRRMGCTKSHLNRLLDTSFYGKSTDEMIRLLNALDYEVEFRLKKVS
jgi:predicted XRE-type DNA-binding protein